MRSLRLGSALFLGLVALGILGVALVYWHHRRIAHLALATQAPAAGEAQDVHIDVVFAFPASGPALACGGLVIWLVCVGLSYMWLRFRR